MENTLFYESSFQSTTIDSHPDRYIPDIEKACQPDNSFVISRRDDTSILSIYGDDTWLLWPYRTTAEQPSPINFIDFSSQTKSDFKWIVFILIYIADTGRASTLSPGTLTQYMTLLRHLSNFCNKVNQKPCNVLGSEILLRKFSHYLINYGSIFRLLPSLLSQLFAIGSKMTGITVLNESTINEIRKQYRLHFQVNLQHPVIPPRIYSNLLTQYWDTIDLFNNYKENLLRFLRRCADNPAYARSRTVQAKHGYRHQTYLPFFEEAAKSHDLLTLFNRFNINMATQITRFLTQIQHTCKELVHAYSGMRHNEALSLKIDCLRSENDKHGEIVHLIGETSKLIGQRKTTAWVTSIEINKAISVAQSIALLVSHYKKFKPENTPLFISVSYLPFSNNASAFKDEVNVNMNFNQIRNHAFSLIDSNVISIVDDDILQLEKIDPLRSWRQEKNFKVGSIWKTSTHQWRRSLAFYVAQSGLVSLPTLKRQLHHITREMTIYYSNGAGFTDLFNEPEHFIQEFKRTKPQADALAYIYNILLSEESINGAHGHHLKITNTNSSATDKKILIEDRKKINDMFKNGEIAYTETAVGVCTSVSPCDKKLLRSLTACFSCPKAVVKSSKVDRLIDRQKQLLNRLDVSSIEYKTESDELEQLLIMKNKLNQRK